MSRFAGAAEGTLTMKPLTARGLPTISMSAVARYLFARWYVALPVRYAALLGCVVGLVACASAGSLESTEARAGDSAQAGAVDLPRCDARPPSADYVQSDFRGLIVALPPEYRILDELRNEPGVRGWLAPDSSAFVVAAEHTAFGMDEEMVEIIAEDGCTLLVSGTEQPIEQFQIISRATRDTAFAAHAIVSIQPEHSLTVHIVGRSRTERARLLGVLMATNRRRGRIPRRRSRTILVALCMAAPAECRHIPVGCSSHAGWGEVPAP
jgi:hypothetical protein